MTDTPQIIFDRLGIPFKEEVLPYYNAGTELLARYGDLIAEEERLKRLNKCHNIFRRWFDDVLHAAGLVRADKDLLLFTYILYAVIRDKAPLSIIPLPDRQRADTDFAPLFSLMFFAEEMVEAMEKRGLSHEIISDTLSNFDGEIGEYYDMFGRSGMRIYVGWFLLYVRGEIVKIGRLEFQLTTLKEKIRVYEKDGDVKILIDGQQMHEKGMVAGSVGQCGDGFFADICEEDGAVSGYATNEFGECVPERITLRGYSERLRFGDKVLAVHIPADGEFSQDLCRRSYAAAKEVFARCYPEFDYKAFHCISWMLEKRLCGIMGRETNITRFAEDYVGFPIKSDGSGAYIFLFHMKGVTDPHQLPEKNSMQSAVKKYLCEGNYYYEKGGIMLR